MFYFIKTPKRINSKYVIQSVSDDTPLSEIAAQSKMFVPCYQQGGFVKFNCTQSVDSLSSTTLMFL